MNNNYPVFKNEFMYDLWFQINLLLSKIEFIKFQCFAF